MNRGYYSTSHHRLISNGAPDTPAGAAWRLANNAAPNITNHPLITGPEISTNGPLAAPTAVNAHNARVNCLSASITTCLLAQRDTPNASADSLTKSPPEGT